MHKFLLATAVAIVSSATASAQTCGSLAVSGAGTAGTELVANLTGATPRGFAVLVIGETAGSTPIRVGSFLNLTIDLDLPFFPVPMGRTDAVGDESLSVAVPAGLLQQFSLQAQAVTLSLTLLPPTVIACKSNPVAFTVGG